MPPGARILAANTTAMPPGGIASALFGTRGRDGETAEAPESSPTPKKEARLVGRRLLN